MKRHILAVAAALAVLTAPALAADPCTLLTKNDAAKVLGSSALTTLHSTTGCTYRTGASSVYVALNTTAMRTELFNASKTTGKAVGGLGAPAYFSTGTLAIMKGNTLVKVGIVTGPSDMARMNPKLPGLAKLVLSRM